MQENGNRGTSDRNAEVFALASVLSSIIEELAEARPSAERKAFIGSIRQRIARHMAEGNLDREERGIAEEIISKALPYWY